jgi:hypothetical protein
METLATVFVIGWGCLAAYLGWLGMQNARLSRRLQELESLVQDHGNTQHPRSRAA